MGTMHDQQSAKRFFAQRVIDQAAVEGEPLSRAEGHMLYWSESDTSAKADDALLIEFEQQTTDERFEAKISGLVERAYESDRARGLSGEYKEAYRRLAEGDHYIQIMLDATIGEKLRRKKWLFF
jgi:hypothetical protein